MNSLHFQTFFALFASLIFYAPKAQCITPVAPAGFINPADMSLAPFSPPPILGSKEDAQDLASVKSHMADRSDEVMVRIGYEDFFTSISSFFGQPYGPLTDQEIMNARKIYAQVSKDIDAYTRKLKTNWHRPRPFNRSKRIQAAVPEPGETSYPSGHAAIARATALTLAKIFPKKSKALLARADEIGLDRVIAGVHHPIDVEAGKKVADVAFELMLKNQNFLKAIEEAQNYSQHLKELAAPINATGAQSQAFLIEQSNISKFTNDISWEKTYLKEMKILRNLKD